MSMWQFGLRIPGARNAWSIWIDRIMSHKERYGFQSAVLLSTCGDISAFTTNFVPSKDEIKNINRLFDMNSRDDGEQDFKLRFVDKTYVIKHGPTDCDGRHPQVLVAFNGSIYLVICRSASKYIVVRMSKHRASSPDDAVAWLTRLSQTLIDRNF